MIFLFFSLAIAEPLSYTIKKGDPAPIDGRLFNDEAVVNLIASNEELQEQCQISLQYQGKTLAAQHALEMEYVKAELEIEKKKSETLIGLRDEEIEDFRTRVKHVLETPNEPLPGNDPVGWVTERKYIEQEFPKVLNDCIQRRTQSIKWLKSLQSPMRENVNQHPRLGTLSVEHFLVNWLAHDQLHIRQITQLKYHYLKHISNDDLNYAGKW